MIEVAVDSSDLVDQLVADLVESGQAADLENQGHLAVVHNPLGPGPFHHTLEAARSPCRNRELRLAGLGIHERRQVPEIAAAAVGID